MCLKCSGSIRVNRPNRKKKTHTHTLFWKISNKHVIQTVAYLGIFFKSGSLCDHLVKRKAADLREPSLCCLNINHTHSSMNLVNRNNLQIFFCCSCHVENKNWTHLDEEKTFTTSVVLINTRICILCSDSSYGNTVQSCSLWFETGGTELLTLDYWGIISSHTGDMAVRQSVRSLGMLFNHFGPEWNILTTVWWIAMKLPWHYWFPDDESWWHDVNWIFPRGPL